MWPLAIGALGSALFAGGASAVGQERANRQNVALARERMTFEADQVAKQMAFQERMSGTAFQRGVEDMRLAGINPMLAYAQGGASTPGGGAASGAQATVQDVVGPAVASAQHARRLNQELRVMYQTERNISNQTAKVAAETQESYKRQDLLEIDKRLRSLQIPELKATAALFSRLGEGGKAAQIGVPLLMRLLSGR